jgi:hypothetical protein
MVRYSVGSRSQLLTMTSLFIAEPSGRYPLTVSDYRGREFRPRQHAVQSDNLGPARGRGIGHRGACPLKSVRAEPARRQCPFRQRRQALIHSVPTVRLFTQTGRIR